MSNKVFQRTGLALRASPAAEYRRYAPSVDTRRKE